jgi:cell division protein FtsZ
MVTINVSNNDNILIIGAGEAGGRLAECFAFNGFNKVVALNTASADLAGLNLKDEDKCLIPVTNGQGAGKDPNVVRNAIDTFYSDVYKFIQSKANGVEYALVLAGLGGGSGGGLAIVLCQIAAELGLPVGIICTLPRNNEGTLVFVNALDNLKEIHQNASTGAISPLIVVDNNKLAKEFNPTAANFWGPLNSAIIRVMKNFNELSLMPSKFISALDRQDLKRVLSVGGTCAIGEFEIPADYKAEDIEKLLHEHFFMDGFDLSSASACGVIVTGSNAILQTSDSAKCIEALFDQVNNLIGGVMFFKGVYEDDSAKFLKVYVMFNGLALPQEHLDQMMVSIKAGYQKIKTQQNRLDGVFADFGSGVGGIFNVNQNNGSKIVRKDVAKPNTPQQQRPQIINTTNNNGIKRGGR